MNRRFRQGSWAVFFVLICLVFALSSPAQKSIDKRSSGLWEDTAISPHDFSNSYYADNGINAKGILGRRTGSDSLSVFSFSSNPNHSSVRVLVTIPAYTQTGDPIFWYPLGELTDSGFMDDKIGFMARETARLFPIYVFPDRRVANFYTFTSVRQGAVIDESISGSSDTVNGLNPLGIREIIVVNYTEKAFGKEGFEIMEYFGKKNGLSVDDTPIIRSLEDLQYLAKNELITMVSSKSDVASPFRGQYAIAPVIGDPTKGAIAKDAFLWMATKDGRPMPTEEMFVWQFGCLQKTGEFCK